jgi:hypothetical protein
MDKNYLGILIKEKIYAITISILKKTIMNWMPLYLIQDNPLNISSRCRLLQVFCALHSALGLSANLTTTCEKVYFALNLYKLPDAGRGLL